MCKKDGGRWKWGEFIPLDTDSECCLCRSRNGCIHRYCVNGESDCE